METRIIQYGSEEYEEMVRFRITVLLEPIGVPSTYIIGENEKNDTFIGAFVQEEMIGCCVLTKKDEKVVQLRQMAVRPDLNGKGIGSDIIRFAEEFARQQNYHILMMNARDPVIDFYKKCGYNMTSDQFFEVGIGHHRMEKVL